MSEFHKKYAVSDAQGIMYQLYNFVNEASQDVVDFVVSNSTTAVFIDSSESNADISRSHQGTSQSHTGLPTTQIKLDTDAVGTNDWYNNYTIEITSGLHDGDTKTITDYFGSTRIAVTTAWGTKNLTGTCAINGTAVVTGSGTSFDTEVAAGDTITLDGETKEVSSVDSATQLTMDSTYTNTKSGETATLDHPSGGVTFDVYRGSWATPTSKDAFGIGSFFVVEVQFNNPGGRKWQAKIRRDQSTTSFTLEGSPNGGFTIPVFATSDLGSGFGSEPTGGAQSCLNVLPGAGDQIYCSSSDLDTYDAGSKKYGYFRCIFEDNSAGTAPYGFYVGGYIPFDIPNDTDPFVQCSRYPGVNDTTTSGSSAWWGRIPTTSNLNRAPLENGQAVTDFSTDGYAALVANNELTVQQESQTRAGAEVECQIYVVSIAQRKLLGYLGDYTMTGISFGVANFQTNASGDRMVMNNLAIRWNP